MMAALRLRPNPPSKSSSKPTHLLPASIWIRAISQRTATARWPSVFHTPVVSISRLHISDENGNKEKADWPRLADMFRNAGYKGYLSLEYEENGDATTA